MQKVTLYCRTADKDGVLHAFPVLDQSSTNRHDSAKRWSGRSEGQWIDGKYVKVDPNPSVYEFDNKFDDVVIRNLEHRGEGGRAYQVIVTHGGKQFRCDLREDALVDAILNVGIEAGGKLNASYAFAIAGSQTNLIRIGSEAYKEALKDAEMRGGKKLGKGDLKIGHRYKTLTGDTGIYMGDVFVREYDCEKKSDKVVKKMVFVKKTEFLSESYDPKDGYYWHVELKTSHNFRMDEGKVVDDGLEQVLLNLKKIGEYYKRGADLNWKKYVEEKDKYVPNRYSYYAYNRHPRPGEPTQLVGAIEMLSVSADKKSVPTFPHLVEFADRWYVEYKCHG